ncbi:MAG TPA: P27 family phage terminase small subunit [Candidatus Saccharimonadales bacterium]|nr:P27 family phage terminase small subunit [Candidatus Saccharimonadales bacterium]
MGERGPVGRSPQAAERLGRPSHGASATPALSVLPGGATRLPEPPEGLGEAAAITWREVKAGAPWLAAADRSTVQELVEREQDLEVCREALRRHGALLEEIVVSPRGDVVGTKLVANPAAAQVVKLQATILQLRAALGLTPIARVRMGLQVLEGERRASKVEELQARARARSARHVS